MGRPGDMSPPEGWTNNNFDDSEWGLPTKSTNNNCFDSHWKMPTVWHEKSKFVFYRIPIPRPEEIVRLAKLDGVIEETITEEF